MGRCLSCEMSAGIRGCRNNKGKVDIMTNKNIFGDIVSFCADNMFPENIAREKMAECARRHGNR